MHNTHRAINLLGCTLPTDVLSAPLAATGGRLEMPTTRGGSMACIGANRLEDPSSAPVEWALTGGSCSLKTTGRAGFDGFSLLVVSPVDFSSDRLS
jgi:hypothetical protein